MRGQGRIFQRGSIWWVGYSRNGREFRESSKSRKEADAKRLLKKRLGEIHAKTFVDPARQRVRLSDLLDELVTEYQNNGRRTVRTLKHHLKHIKKFFCADRAIDVTEGRLERYKASRLEEKAARSTVNRELAAIRRAFSLARKRKILNHSPSFELFREDNVREGFVEPEQIEALLKELPEDLSDFVRFAFLTSWRRSEIASLSWDDVDVPGRAITLRRAHSKNNHGRVVPLEGELYSLILKRWEKRHIRVGTDGADHGLVFHRGKGRPVGEFRKRWRKAVTKIGLPGLVLHDLRGSGIRCMVRGGTPEVVCMKISGHRTRATFDRYDITSERDLREAVKRTEAYIAKRSREKKKQKDSSGA